MNKTRLTYVIALGLLALTVIGWRFQSPQGVRPVSQDQSPTPTPAAAPIVPAPQGKPVDSVLLAHQSIARAKSLQMTILVTSPNGNITSSVINYAAPDRLMATTQNGSRKDAFIVIKGQGTWANVNGNWIMPGMDMSSFAFSFFDPNNIGSLSQALTAGNVAYVGPDVIGNKQMWVYQYDVTGSSAGAPDLFAKNGTYKVWIGTDDGLPYQIVGMLPSPANPGKQAQVQVMVDFNANVQIQAPQ